MRTSRRFWTVVAFKCHKRHNCNSDLHAAASHPLSTNDVHRLASQPTWRWTSATAGGPAWTVSAVLASSGLVVFAALGGAISGPSVSSRGCGGHSGALFLGQSTTF